MLTVHVLENLLWPAQGREDLRVTHCGQTPRTIRSLCKLPIWCDDEVQVTHMGKVLTEADLDRPLVDGADLMLAPAVRGAEFFIAAGLFLLKSAAAAAIAVGIQYAIAALHGRPRTPQIRGDIQSATFGWDGMATSWGVGSPKGWVYGRHRVPGQVISSNQFELGDDDILSVSMSLARGRVSRIAGIDLTTTPEINFLGGLYPGSHTSLTPSGIRINGTVAEPRDLACHLRAGVHWQTPLPGAARQYSTFPVQKPLPQGSYFGGPRIPGPRYTLTAPSKSIRVRVHFDYLYTQQAAGPGTARASINAQLYDSVTGAPVGATITGGDVTRSSTVGFNFSVLFSLPTDRTYDVEVGMAAINLVPGTVNVSATWAVAVEELAGEADEIAFINQALMHLDVRAIDRLVGSNPTITVPVDGRLLRWKLGGVWQDPTFDHAGTGKVPGRNPAWVLYDWLTAKDTLGRWVDATTIPEDAFEQWAEWSDQLVDDGNGGTHPRHSCDLVIDRGESGWEVAQRIARTGRAILMPAGRGFRIHFEHPDAVGFERPVRQIFAQSNTANLEIGYRGSLDRDNILDGQILDETIEWEQNLIPQEDPGANLNDPHAYRAEPIKRGKRDLFGITRPQHARRELAWMLAFDRLSWSEVRFETAVNALGCEIGDLIGVQHDVPRWFDTETGGFRTTRAGTAATSIYLDHAVTLEVGRTYQVGVMLADNSTDTAVPITAPAATYPADTAIAIGTAVTVRKGAVVGFGEEDAVLRVYQITNIEQTEGFTYRVTATLYDPAAFVAEVTAPSGDLGPPVPAPVESVATGLEVEHARAIRSPDGRRVILGWASPSGTRSPVRIYLRPKRTAAEEVEALDLPVEAAAPSRWQLVFEGQGDRVEVEGLQPFADYELVGVTRTRDGVWLSPQTATPITVQLEEFPQFPPPSVRTLTATANGEGVLFSWTEIGPEPIDYFEVRRVGPAGTWLEAETVARTTRTRFLLTGAPAGAQTYAVAARSANGLYLVDRPTATVTVEAPASWSQAQASNADEFDGAAVGVHLDSDGSLVLSPTFLIGTYETAIMDAGVAGPSWWSLNLSGWATWSGELPEVELASGEAYWWETDGRPASPLLPGVDFDLDTDDQTLRIEDELTTFAGPAGACGSHTRVRVDAAWDSGTGVFGAWEPFQTGARVAKRVKFRLTLEREDELWQVHVGPGFNCAATAAINPVDAHVAEAFPHPQYATHGEVTAAAAGAIALHKAQAGQHPEYVRRGQAMADARGILWAEVGSRRSKASGYASLDSNGRLVEPAQVFWDGVSSNLTMVAWADLSVPVRSGSTVVSLPITTWITSQAGQVTSDHLSADAILAMRSFSTS